VDILGATATISTLLEAELGLELTGHHTSCSSSFPNIGFSDPLAQAQVHVFLPSAIMRSIISMPRGGHVVKLRKGAKETVQGATTSAYFPIIVHYCYDGGTCTVTLNDPFLTPVLGDHIPVRLAGVDTPELKGDCAVEWALAIQARDFLVARLATAARVELHSPARDTYFCLNGRLLADGQGLITANLARPYDGGKKLPFC
jgi:micrococcal nuclease